MNADLQSLGRILPRRAAILVPAMLLASAVSFIAWAGVYRLYLPERALAAAPWDARSKSVMGAQMVIRDPSPATVLRAGAHAAAALRRQPVDPVAIRLLGASRDVEGRGADALRLMLGAQSLSRRDLLTQLWLIQHFSQTDDVARVLRHYEIALTGSKDSLPILFPVLVAAANDRELVRPMSELLQRSRVRSWRGPLLNELIAKGSVAPNVAALSFAVLDPSWAEDQPLYRALVTRMIEFEAFDLAFEAYRRATRDGGAPVATLRDPRFRVANRMPPFDWELVQDVDRSASPIANRSGGLQISASGSANGVLARQLVRLSPGNYRLSFDLALDGPPIPGLMIIIRCASKPGQGGVIAQRAPIPPRPGNHSVTVTAMSRCTWHAIEIVFEGRGDGEFAGTLSRLELRQDTGAGR
jgi:hypothetical protein